jgi:hypothetical protein
VINPVREAQNRVIIRGRKPGRRREKRKEALNRKKQKAVLGAMGMYACFILVSRVDSITHPVKDTEPMTAAIIKLPRDRRLKTCSNRS